MRLFSLISPLGFSILLPKQESMRKVWILIILIGFGTADLIAQDWRSLHVKGRFDTISEQFTGETWQVIDSLAGLDTLKLNALRTEVLALELNGEKADFVKNDTALFIPLKKGSPKVELYIHYRVKPRKGLYFIGWQDTSFRSRRQIWTQGQGIDHRHWIPHHDNQSDKILFSAEWIFNANYEVMSNGVLDSTWLVEGEKHWLYSMKKPMSSYLIALAIDRYEITRTIVNSVPHYLYHYPERKGDTAWYYYKHKAIATFLEKEIGYPYPWPNYKQAPVQDFRHGAMENTCATIFGDFFLVDQWAFADQNYTYVDAHEFAHQWFGNLVTAKNAKHHWLHEGFATYYQWLSEGQLYGDDFFAWELEKARVMVESATEVEALPLAHPKAGSARFYQKGGWLLFMLRNYVGDSIYRGVISDYLNWYEYQVVENQDLIELFAESSDANIKDFFKTWLYADKEPSLRIERNPSSSKIEIELIGELPQDLVLVEQFEGKTHRRKLRLKEGRQKIELNSEESLFYFDHYREMLLKVSEQKTAADWYFQYESSSSFLSKYFVLENLVGQAPSGILAWSRAIAEDSTLHFALRSKAFEVYASQDLPESRKVHLLESLLTTRDIQLQKRLLKIALLERWELARNIVEPLRSGPSYQLRKSALELSIDPRNLDSNQWLYDSLFAMEPGIPGNEILLTSLLYRMLLFQDQEAYHQLLDFASISFDFNTRITALQYLAYLPHPNQDYLKQLWDAFFNSNWKLVRIARSGLQKEREKQPDKWEDYYRAHYPDWTDFQKRKAERTFGE